MGDAESTDPWAEACAEDLAAERARRRAAGQHDAGREAVESLRGFLHRLAGEADHLGPAVGLAARQATAALDPVLERNRDAVTHLARAGDELAAAVRAALQTAEPADAAGRDGSGRPGAGDRAADAAPDTTPEPEPDRSDHPRTDRDPAHPGDQPERSPDPESES